MKEGIFRRGSRCFRVARLFDDCDIRREMITYDVSRLYRNGKYLGDCMIEYEIAPELCGMLKSKYNPFFYT
jgi:hypothetical protein